MPSSSPFDVTAANDTGDYVLPFQFENLPIRGRLISLELTASTITGYHPYPPAVASLLGQTLAVTAGLASLLSFEGAFTVQTSGDGFVPMMVCDATPQGGLRGYAQMRAGQMAFGQTLPELIGTGYLAFTAEQARERYQGIVSLEGKTLAECIEQYFRQSEQIQTYVRLAAGALGRFGWKANGLLLQQMPNIAPPSDIAVDNQETAAEGWRRLGMILQTLGEEELLAVDTDNTLLLRRLFAEDTVRIFPARPVHPYCRCSVERIEQVLTALPENDLRELAEDGETSLTCEFCAREFKITRDDLLRLLSGNV